MEVFRSKKEKMLSWILIIIAIALAIVAYIKLKEFGHKTKFTALIIVLILFLGTVGYVWLETKPNLATYDGFVELGKAYGSWVGGLFNNLGNIVVYAVKQEWGASNPPNLNGDE